jgi:ABC-type glycerol-3-phosphate transport system permease component
MSQLLTVCLVAVAANLVGVMVIYAVMAQALARFSWRRGGIFAVIALIVAAQLFWIAPALLIVAPRDPEGASCFALWFGNWIVSGFGIVLFSQRAKSIPRSLEDSAQMDGLGAFGVWRHAVFPFVRRDLFIIAAFTVMATLLPFWGCVTLPEAGGSIVLFQRFLSTSGRLAFMAALSVAGAVPLIGIFLLVSRRSLASPLPPLVRG